jgi:hypothetical protein
MKINLNNVVVFDVETEPLSSEFFNAQKTGAVQFDLFPRPRVCVCYDSRSGKYRTYLPDEFQSLYTKLLKRPILSFNGKAFDVNVILKHLNKDQNDALSKKHDHYDLLDLITKTTGKRYHLDDLVRANLGERKHTKGRDMENLDIETLIEACRSDVDHTYRLMKLFLSGNMVYKYYSTYKSYSKEDDDKLCGINVPPDIAVLLMEANEKAINLEEALINGHKYSEASKIRVLDECLLDKTGKRFTELVPSDKISLGFEERCKTTAYLLMELGIQEK